MSAPSLNAPSLSVSLLPALLPTNTSPAEAVDVALVIDVLRATTTATAFLEHGASAVVFAPSIEDAWGTRDYLWARDGGAPLLAGERGGLKTEGFDLGNSPLDAEAARGQTVVMNTTNGTGAAHTAAEHAAMVRLACLRNAPAAAEASAGAGSVAVVCAGTDGRVSLDDCYAAGVLVRELLQRRAGSLQAWTLNDSARMVLSLLDTYPTPEAALRASTHGQRLLGLGLEADLHFCAEVGVSAVVPELVGREAGGLRFQAKDKGSA